MEDGTGNAPGMHKGFVFGKFYPLHTGHVALMHFACSQCDELTVLVCCSDQEDIPASVRTQWVTEALASQPNVTVQALHYREEDLPNTSVSARSVSQQWGQVFSKLLRDVQVVVTSEPYGDYVAEAMGIQHVMYDEGRKRHPIQASLIRQAPFAYWQYLPAVVRPYYVKKVILLGTESTGKSTLSEKLAAYFYSVWVAEAGRAVVPQTTACQYHDLEEIAMQHAAQIREALPQAQKLLFIDTDIHITQSYAQFLFGRTLSTSADVLVDNQADLYLYLNADCPFYQDGTRLPQEQRRQLDASHRALLTSAGITFIEISGPWHERFLQCVRAVEAQFGL